MNPLIWLGDPKARSAAEEERPETYTASHT